MSTKRGMCADLGNYNNNISRYVVVVDAVLDTHANPCHGRFSGTLFTAFSCRESIPQTIFSLVKEKFTDVSLTAPARRSLARARGLKLFFCKVQSGRRYTTGHRTTSTSHNNRNEKRILASLLSIVCLKGQRQHTHSTDSFSQG